MKEEKRDGEEKVLDILNSLIQEIGYQVTRDYVYKNGIWEGMSTDNERSRQKYAKDLLAIVEEAKAEERKATIKEIVKGIDTHHVTISEYMDLQNEVTLIPANMTNECQFVLADRRRLVGKLQAISAINNDKKG